MDLLVDVYSLGVSATDGAGRGLTGNGSPASERGHLLVKFQSNEFHGQRTLMAYCPWCRKELDTTEELSTHIHTTKITLLSSGSQEGMKSAAHHP